MLIFLVDVALTGETAVTKDGNSPLHYFVRVTPHNVLEYHKVTLSDSIYYEIFILS